jgi:hypothetical protein
MHSGIFLIGVSPDCDEKRRHMATSNYSHAIRALDECSRARQVGAGAQLARRLRREHRDRWNASCIVNRDRPCSWNLGERVKYLAVCVLSLVAHVTADGASLIDSGLAAAVSSSPADSALAALLGGVLVALQLRRRQKSLRMPRRFYG